MITKKLTYFALAAAMVATSSASFAMDDQAMSKQALKDAETAFHEVCIEDNDNSAVECLCAARVLKEELPKKHYALVMDLIAHGVADDRGEIQMDDGMFEDIMTKHDAGFFTLISFGFQMIDAADKLDDCDLKNDNFKIQL